MSAGVAKEPKRSFAAHVLKCHHPSVAGDTLIQMEASFTDGEKALLEQAFQIREGQTEEQRAIMRAAFEVKWPELVAYINQTQGRGENMRGDVLFALAEDRGGPSLEDIVWYMLDRAVMMNAKSGL